MLLMWKLACTHNQPGKEGYCRKKINGSCSSLQLKEGMSLQWQVRQKKLDSYNIVSVTLIIISIIPLEINARAVENLNMCQEQEKTKNPTCSFLYCWWHAVVPVSCHPILKEFNMIFYTMYIYIHSYASWRRNATCSEERTWDVRRDRPLNLLKSSHMSNPCVLNFKRLLTDRSCSK